MSINVVFLESTQGWPKRFTANNTKVELLAKGLIEQGDEITIINSLLGEEKVNEGYNQQIKYYSFKKRFFKPISRFINLIGLFKLLKKNKKIEKKNIIIMGGPYYLIFLLIVLFAKILGYKTIVTLTEWAAEIKAIKGIKKFDSIIFDYTFGFFVNGIMPISTFLEKKVQIFKKEILKVPIIAEYKNLEINKKKVSNYFLYCGSIDYYRPIELIINSFSSIVNKGYDTELKLILSGNESLIQAIRYKIEDIKLENRISTLTQLDYNDLIEAYNNALALLIPLEDTIQDKARFSQKIAEYLSASRPIITCSVGEIKYYFEDSITAYISASFSIAEYSQQMEKVLLNPLLANEIGRNGRKLGELNFDYRINGIKVHKFLSEI